MHKANFEIQINYQFFYFNVLENLHQRTSSLYQTSKEEHLNRKTSKDEASNSLFDSNIHYSENLISPVNHEIIIHKGKSNQSSDQPENQVDSQNNNFKVLKTNCSFTFNSIEDNEKCEFLVKFGDKGNYYIILDAEYKIIKKEILDDFSVMKNTGETHVEVVNAFINKFE